MEKMREYVGEGKIEYDAYLRDDTQEVAEAYGATCTPDPFLFENDGGVFRLYYHGRLDDALDPDAEPTERIMKEKVEALLAGEGVDEWFLPSRGCSIKWKD